MRRIRPVQATQSGLVPLCVMRRSRYDEPIVGGMAYDFGYGRWEFRQGNHAGHTTPATGYDTIVYFTNGAVGMIDDRLVDEALAAVGLREVR